jgi:hypothetical protein
MPLYSSLPWFALGSWKFGHVEAENTGRCAGPGVRLSGGDCVPAPSDTVRCTHPGVTLSGGDCVPVVLSDTVRCTHPGVTLSGGDCMPVSAENAHAYDLSFQRGDGGTITDSKRLDRSQPTAGYGIIDEEPAIVRVHPGCTARLYTGDSEGWPVGGQHV